MKVMVTGAAGFIGYFVSERLLARGDEVVGLDNLDPYYDVALKQARLERLQQHPGYRHAQVDLADRDAVDRVFREARPDRVVHLAAQAGVRYSLTNPQAYINANVTGFLNVLENLRAQGTEHLVFASTSSVYGLNRRMPYSVARPADHPVSLYAATKKSNELMAHTYSHLFAVPSTGLRFFTVYGPWGRPDMALFLFTRKILAREPIDVFNYGRHTRDFTYIDDIAEGVLRVLDKPAVADPSWDPSQPEPHRSSAPYRLYNIGSNNPVDLLAYIEMLEQTLGIEAIRNLQPLQPGDVADTFADVDELIEDFDYAPRTTVEEGVRNFVAWYKDYYRIDEVAHNVR